MLNDCYTNPEKTFLYMYGYLLTARQSLQILIDTNQVSEADAQAVMEILDNGGTDRASKTLDVVMSNIFLLQLSSISNTLQ